jgi:hypothetical protein
MRRVVALVSIFASAFALAGACGPKADDVPELRSDHCPVTGCKDASGYGDAEITIPNEPLEPWDTSGADPISGIYAVEARISARVGLVIETRELFRLRLLVHGTHVKQTTTLCALKLPDVQGVATLIVPPKLQALLWTKPIDAEGEFLDSSQSIYQPPESLVVIGAKLADPANDPLPTIQDPSTAADEDNDGNPGVTLGAKLVTCPDVEDLYLALRTGATLTGKVSGNVIQGSADVKLDYSVVGISDPCLQTATTINITVLPGSKFTAKPVGAAEDIDKNGNVSCAEMAIQAADLFGDYWAN